MPDAPSRMTFNRLAVAFVHFICTFPEINVEDDVPGPYRLM